MCVDISQLTNDPKSIMDVDGSSGRSLHEMRHHLESLSFQDRPDCLSLACVRTLAHAMRKGLPNPEVGTQLIAQALRALGYIGAWEPAGVKDV